MLQNIWSCRGPRIVNPHLLWLVLHNHGYVTRIEWVVRTCDGAFWKANQMSESTEIHIRVEATPRFGYKPIPPYLRNSETNTRDTNVARQPMNHILRKLGCEIVHLWDTTAHFSFKSLKDC